MRIYATVIVDNDHGGQPELRFHPTREAATSEAEQAYEYIVDSGGSVAVYWYDGQKQGVVTQTGDKWDGPEEVREAMI